jgi:hypothetical protein
VRPDDALRLLSTSPPAHARVAIARALGADGAPLPVGREAARTLRDVAGVEAAEIVEGAGGRRALLAEIVDATPLRDAAGAIARWLACATPTPHWLLVLSRRDDAEIAVAVWRTEHGAPRVSALVADPRRIHASDAETLCALAAAVDADGAATHERWCALLGR